MELCSYLPWDSEFFKFPIARINTEKVNESDMAVILAWCKDQGIRCLYFLADINDLSGIHCAEKHGFNFIDIRFVLESNKTVSTLAPFKPPSEQLLIRRYQSSDLPVLREIAKKNHPDSRFFKDVRFPPHSAESLYALWMGKCCTEGEETVFVCSCDSIPAGYISCKIAPEKSGHISLAGVGKNFRKKGIGSLLVKSAVEHFLTNGFDRITVVTQASNINAVRLYNNNGFFPIAVQCWYHKWFLD